MKLHGDFCYQTDIGNKRKINEDYAMIVTNPHGHVLMVVCDGMGGHHQGDHASRETVALLVKAFKKKTHFLTTRGARKWLEKTIRHINQAIYNEEKDVPYSEHMGTTLVACLLLGKDVIFVNIGDSRAYTLRVQQGSEVYDLEQITSDDTIADYLVNIGRIRKEEREHYKSRHLLTNAVGLFPSVRMEIKTVRFLHEKHHSPKGQETFPLLSVLLCSDGLFSMISKEEILAVLTSGDEVEAKVETLISMAKQNGGDDNIAVALWEDIL